MFNWLAAIRVESPRTDEVFELRWGGEMPDCIRFSPDGQRIAAGGRDRTVRAWQLGDRRELWCSEDLGAGIRCVAVAADGRVAAGTNWDSGAVVVLDADSGTVQARLPGHPGGVSGLAFSPDGSLLASVGADKVLRVWELAACGSGTAAHGWPVRITAVSDDGASVAAGFDDGSVWVCDVANGWAQMSAGRHLGQVTALAFSSDGLFLATGSEDGTARVWNFWSGEELARSGVPEDKTPTGVLRLDALGAFAPDLRPAVNSVRFKPDGEQVEFSNGRAHLWNWRTGESPAEAPAPGEQEEPSGRPDGPRAVRDLNWAEEGGATVLRAAGGEVVAVCPVPVRPGPPPRGDRVWVGHVGSRPVIYVLESLSR